MPDASRASDKTSRRPGNFVARDFHGPLVLLFPRGRSRTGETIEPGYNAISMKSVGAAGPCGSRVPRWRRSSSIHRRYLIPLNPFETNYRPGV